MIVFSANPMLVTMNYYDSPQVALRNFTILRPTEIKTCTKKIIYYKASISGIIHKNIFNKHEIY